MSRKWGQDARWIPNDISAKRETIRETHYDPQIMILAVIFYKMF